MIDAAFDPSDRENAYILAWWSPAHDKALQGLIDKWPHTWPWHASDLIAEMTPDEVLDHWRERDPLCHQYAWYNILINFAGSRALLPEYRLPPPVNSREKPCPCCGEAFIEASLDARHYEACGGEFCSVCLDAAFLDRGTDRASREAMLAYILALREIVGRIPPQDSASPASLTGLHTLGKRVELLRLLAGKPSLDAVKREFGSWFAALIAAGLLADGTQKLSRGVRSIALDGHVCLSLGERTICDLLYATGVEHGREPRYPGSQMRADFLIGEHLIEYLGLAGDHDYDQKTERKVALAKGAGIKLTLLKEQDLRDIVALEARLLRIAADEGL